MKKILLKSPSGERWIDEGKPFRFLLGEVVAEDIDGNSIVAEDNSERELKEGIAEKGIQWGDAIAKLAKVFRIPHCSKCEQRRRILNAARELGIKETLHQLSEIR
jgi:hypothetical protein